MSSYFTSEEGFTRKPMPPSTFVFTGYTCAQISIRQVNHKKSSQEENHRNNHALCGHVVSVFLEGLPICHAISTPATPAASPSAPAIVDSRNHPFLQTPKLRTLLAFFPFPFSTLRSTSPLADYLGRVLIPACKRKFFSTESY